MGTNKNKAIAAILLLFVGMAVQAQYTQLLDSAARYYTSNKFEKAIDTYEGILKNGFESPELYYNLGNAYYKSNKIPLAIVNYERANKLNPNDPDIEFNLQLANTHVIDKLDVLPEFFLASWWNNFIRLFSSNMWAFISMAVFVLALVGLLMFFLTTSRALRQTGFWLGIVFMAMAVFSFNFARKQYWVTQNEPDAIIITPSIVVKSSPADSGTDLFLIHEGLKVKITDRLGEWREIKLSNGSEGWVKVTDLIVV